MMLSTSRPIIGYHASHEQFPPDELLTYVQEAEAAGFEAAMCSDHWAPWSPRQGQSGYAWSWLGAAMQATALPFGVVCAPGQRYHPAIIAQAAATIEVMFPGRFWIALGSGQLLNEHITGEPWPTKPERNERLQESAEVIRRLLAGEEVTHRGRVTVSEARLWTRPPRPPMIVGAAVTPETAGWLGSWADALITVWQAPERLDRIIHAFRSTGGEKKPMFLQVHLATGETDDAARASAFAEWRENMQDNTVMTELRHPEQASAAASSIRPEDLDRGIRISSSSDQHVEWLGRELERGFSALFLHEVGRDQRGFIEVFGERVLPQLRG